ncbi:toxin-antitoxin system, toxin component (plasmid) [Streptomyces sp. BI20]|uniref:toxin-antitoxin system, toxin component n=1 Tax=Streptomyces sp. BI20 TaxID=3403460 RepID=UPI003C74B4FB
MNRRKMGRHVNTIVAGVGRPVPSDPDALFESLRACVERQLRARGEEARVELHFREFPVDTVTGLMLDLTTRKIVIVEANTTKTHQLIILAHEIWHLLEGHGHVHGAEPAAVRAAARLLGGDLDLESAVEQVATAARTDFDVDDERDAETFGLRLGAVFRPYLENDAERPPTDGLAGRIHSSLVHRGFRR